MAAVFTPDFMGFFGNVLIWRDGHRGSQRYGGPQRFFNYLSIRKKDQHYLYGRF